MGDLEGVVIGIGEGFARCPSILVAGCVASDDLNGYEIGAWALLEGDGNSLHITLMPNSFGSRSVEGPEGRAYRSITATPLQSDRLASLDLGRKDSEGNARCLRNCCSDEGDAGEECFDEHFVVYLCFRLKNQ